MPISSRHRWPFFILSLFLVSILAPLAWVQGLPLCPFKQISGFDCPGCGMSRAFVYFFHGQFAESFSQNAGAPLLILYFGLQLSQSACKRDRTAWLLHGKRYVILTFLVVLLVHFLWRNALLLGLKFH